MQWRSIAVSGALALGLWSCGAEFEVSDVDVSGESQSQSQAINGTVTYSASCSQGERDIIHISMGRLITRLEQSAAFIECLKAGLASWDNGAMPEDIYARLSENLPTHIECVDSIDDAGSAGQATPNIPYESLKLRKSFIAGGDYDYIAGLITHEVAHNKGWRHPDRNAPTPDYKITVNEQVKFCIAYGQPYGMQRSEAPGATELSRAGGDSGDPFERSCVSGRFLTGVTGFRSTTALTELTGLCDGTFAMSKFGSHTASSTAVAVSCQPNEVVVGVRGRADAMLIGVNPICADRTAVANEGSHVAVERRLSTWSGGREFRRSCPRGMAVNRFAGQSGGRIDSLRLGCEKVSGTPRATRTTLGMIGTASGPSSSSSCLGHGGMVGIFGAADPFTGMVRLGGVCRPTSLNRTTPAHPDISMVASYLHVAPSWGDRTAGATFDDRCQAGQLVIGLDVRDANGQVQSVRARCARPDQWSSNDLLVPYTSTPARGATLAGGEAQRTCPRGSYLVGLRSWATGNDLTGLMPVCQRLGAP